MKEIFCKLSLSEVWNPLKSEKNGFPLFLVLYQAPQKLSSADAFISVFSLSWPGCNQLGWDQLIWSAAEEYSTFFFHHQKLLCHCPSALESTIQSTLLHFCLIWADSNSLCTSQFIRLLLPSVTLSINTSDLSHWKPYMSMPSHCLHELDKWCCMPPIMSRF